MFAAAYSSRIDFEADDPPIWNFQSIIEPIIKIDQYETLKKIASVNCMGNDLHIFQKYKKVDTSTTKSYLVWYVGWNSQFCMFSVTTLSKALQRIGFESMKRFFSHFLLNLILNTRFPFLGQRPLSLTSV